MSLAVLVALAALLVPTSVAAQKSPTKNRPTPKAATVRTTVLTTSFDATVQRLQSNFLGHDVERIITSVLEQREKETKSEFETTAEHQKRIATESNRLYGDLTHDSTFAFVVDLGETQFDAEEAELRVIISATTDDGLLLVHLADKATVEHYVGSNAFGASMDVTKLRGTRYGLSILNKDAVSGLRYNLRIPMAVPTAKTIRSVGKALLVCELTPEPTVTATNAKSELIQTTLLTQKPTRDIPFDALVINQFLKVKVNSLWLFDPNTGEVFHRETLDEH